MHRDLHVSLGIGYCNARESDWSKHTGQMAGVALWWETRLWRLYTEMRDVEIC